MAVKCEVCGRFMSYAEMDDARIDFTPLHDGPMGDVPESIEFTHRACESPNNGGDQE